MKKWRYLRFKIFVVTMEVHCISHDKLKSLGMVRIIELSFLSFKPCWIDVFTAYVKRGEILEVC